jgi:hypothetical protein
MRIGETERGLAILTELLADADLGPGGNITIEAPVFARSPEPLTIIQASSNQSTPGEVEIRTRADQIPSDIAALPREVPEALQILRNVCRAGEPAAGELYLEPRDGLPASGYGLLAPSMAQETDG